MTDGGRLATLDGLRGVAALLVFALHAKPLFGPIAPNAYLAVDLFFVLSGFVLAQAYERRLADGLSSPDFMRMRLIRLYPLYALGLLVGLATGLNSWFAGLPVMQPYQSVAAAVLSAFFIPTAIGGTGEMFPLDPPAWSLLFELVVNFAYALTARWLTTKRLVLISSAALIGTASITFQHGGLNFGVQGRDILMGLLRAVSGFSFGVMLNRTRPLRMAPPSILLATVTILLWLPIAPHWRPAYDLACAAVAWPLVVLAGAAVEPRFSTPYRYLGGISYGVYTIHYPLVWLVRTWADQASWSPKVCGVAVLAGLLVVCPVLDRNFDQPLRRWLSRRSGPPRRSC